MAAAAVALQTQGKWRKIESSEVEDTADDEYTGGVLRLWEGDVMDCFEDRHLCIESACCPCYRFGKNMTRAGFGSCFLQGVVHMILIAGIQFNVAAFAVTKRHCFIYLAIAFILLIGSYLGFFLMQIRRKFNIRGADSFFDDFIHHLACPFCTLTQESKTLEMNNVHDGIWHGRGDALCIGGYSEGKALLQIHLPLLYLQCHLNPNSTQQSSYKLQPSYRRWYYHRLMVIDTVERHICQKKTFMFVFFETVIYCRHGNSMKKSLGF